MPVHRIVAIPGKFKERKRRNPSQPFVTQLPGFADPVKTAKGNVAFVIAERMTNTFDSEQAQQALEALNGSRKEE